MTENLDIVKLIEKNPIIRLTDNYQNKFIEKIKLNFKDTEQQLFVSSFYCYLNYNSKTEFIIDLDNVWKWLGYSRKGFCKRILEKHFIINIDYKISEEKAASPTGEAELSEEKVASPTAIKPNLGGAGLNKETILMTINTFKKLCLKSKTKKADEIHDYFIKMEELLNEIVNEESIELRLQLENNEQKLQIKDNDIKKLTEDKRLEKHNILLREFGNIGSIVYIIMVKTISESQFIVKIGESRVGVKSRYDEHKKNYDECIILDCFIVKDSKNFESFLHKTFRLSKVTDLIGHENENELFLIGKELSYINVINIIEQNIKYYNDNYTELEKLKLENNNLQIIQEFNQDKNNLQDIMTLMMHNNNILCNKINNLEKIVIDLRSQIIINNTRNLSNFNETLQTLGPRVQMLNIENDTIIKVFDSISQCMQENPDLKRPSLNQAIKNNSAYKTFRWNYIDRALDPNIIHNKEPTKIVRLQHLGYIAKLNIDKTEILRIYLDRKTASMFNCYPSSSSLDDIVKNGNLSKGNYYVLYNDCSDSLKENYITPILYKNGVGKFDINNNLIQEFLHKQDCKINGGITEKTLNKALDKNIAFNGHFYRFIGEKLEC